MGGWGVTEIIIHIGDKEENLILIAKYFGQRFLHAEYHFCSQNLLRFNPFNETEMRDNNTDIFKNWFWLLLP